MQLVRLPRKAIERLPPYPSLILVGLPLAIAEPMKLAVLFIAGDGHWVVGSVGMLCAYAVSLFVTERLFVLVKPKLLQLPWFAVGWAWFVTLRRTVWSRLKTLWPGKKPRPARRRRRRAPSAAR